MTTVTSKSGPFDPSQDPALQALIAQQSASAAHGLAADLGRDDPQSPAIQGMSAALQSNAQGAALLSDAVTPGTVTQVDLQGLSATDMVKVVFGGVNQVDESSLSDQLAELNRHNALSATLGRFQLQLEMLQPGDDGNIAVPKSVLDALQTDGVNVSSLGLPAGQDPNGNVELSEKQMNALLQNVLTAIDTNNSSQQSLFQQTTSTRDTATQALQLMTSLQHGSRAPR